MNKTDIKSLTHEELQDLLKGMGEKPFRAGQLYRWMHEKLAASFDEMTNLSKDLRGKLAENCTFTALKPVCVRISQIDDTRKYLAIRSAFPLRSAAGWAAVSAPPPLTAWRET